MGQAGPARRRHPLPPRRRQAPARATSRSAGSSPTSAAASSRTPGSWRSRTASRSSTTRPRRASAASRSPSGSSTTSARSASSGSGPSTRRTSAKAVQFCRDVVRAAGAVRLRPEHRRQGVLLRRDDREGLPQQRPAAGRAGPLGDMENITKFPICVMVFLKISNLTPRPARLLPGQRAARDLVVAAPGDRLRPPPAATGPPAGRGRPPATQAARDGPRRRRTPAAGRRTASIPPSSRAQAGRRHDGRSRPN